MEYRDNRYDTFEETYQRNTKVKRYWTYEFPKKTLAADSGFFFNPTKKYHDQITCINCKKSETNIENIQDIVSYHLSNTPNCQLSLILSHKVAINNLSPDNIYNYWSSQLPMFAEPLSKMSIDLRLRTFKNLKYDKISHNSVPMQELAKAGFYFSPLNESINDRVECIYCQISLDSWDTSDNPIEEHHKMGLSNCYFLHKYQNSLLNLVGSEGQALRQIYDENNDSHDSQMSEEIHENGGHINILNSPTQSQVSLKKKNLIKKKEIELGNPILNVRRMRTIHDSNNPNSQQVTPSHFIELEIERPFSDESSGFSSDYKYSSDSSSHSLNSENAKGLPRGDLRKSNGSRSKLGSNSTHETNSKASGYHSGSDEDLNKLISSQSNSFESSESEVFENSDLDYADLKSNSTSKPNKSKRYLENLRQRQLINRIFDNEEISEEISDSDYNHPSSSEKTNDPEDDNMGYIREDHIMKRSVDSPDKESQSPIKLPKTRGRKRKNELPDSQETLSKEPELKRGKIRDGQKNFVDQQGELDSEHRPNETSLRVSATKNTKKSMRQLSSAQAFKDEPELDVPSLVIPLRRSSRLRGTPANKTNENVTMIKSLPITRRKIAKNSDSAGQSKTQKPKPKGRSQAKSNLENKVTKDEEKIHQFLNSPSKSKKVKLKSNQEKSPISILDLSNHNLGDYNEENLAELELMDNVPATFSNENYKEGKRKFNKSRTHPVKVQRIESSSDSKEIFPDIRNQQMENSVLQDDQSDLNNKEQENFDQGNDHQDDDDSPLETVDRTVIYDDIDDDDDANAHNDDLDVVVLESDRNVPSLSKGPVDKNDIRTSPIKKSLPSDVSVSTDIEVGKNIEALHKEPWPSKTADISIKSSPEKVDGKSPVEEKSLNSSEVNNQYQDEINYLMGLNNKLAKSMMDYTGDSLSSDNDDNGRNSEKGMEVPFNQQQSNILDSIYDQNHEKRDSGRINDHKDSDIFDHETMKIDPNDEGTRENILKNHSREPSMVSDGDFAQKDASDADNVTVPETSGRKDLSTAIENKSIHDGEAKESPFKDYLLQGLDRLSKEPTPFTSTKGLNRDSEVVNRSPSIAKPLESKMVSNQGYDDEYSRYERDGSFIIGIALPKSQSPRSSNLFTNNGNVDDGKGSDGLPKEEKIEEHSSEAVAPKKGNGQVDTNHENKTNDDNEINEASGDERNDVRNDEFNGGDDDSHDNERVPETETNKHVKQNNDSNIKTTNAKYLWNKSNFKDVTNKITTLEQACEYLEMISKAPYSLKDDLEGDLTQFIANMPEHEENMTLKQWIEHNSVNCQKVVRDICNEIIENFKYERNRALELLENLPTVD